MTDIVDGWIARTWDLVTSFGKVADPIADKALTGAAFCCCRRTEHCHGG